MLKTQQGFDYLWAADIHLDTAKTTASELGKSWISKYPNAKALFLTGDIGKADSIELYLKQLRQSLKIPIYFVLGNHDYWGSSFHCVDSIKWEDGLYFLNNESPIKIDDYYLIGNGCWYDCGYSNKYNNGMSDFDNIKELSESPIKQSIFRSEYLLNNFFLI